MAFDPDAYLAAKKSTAFDPDAYLASKAPPPEPESDTAKAIRGVTETAADAMTGRASVLSFLDPVLGAAGAVGSYFLPDTKTGGGDFSARMNREMQGIRRTRTEGFERSPVVATGAAIQSAMPIAKVLQAAPAAAQAISPFSQTAAQGAGGWPLLQRMLAGTADAALFNAGNSYLSNLDNDPTRAALEAGTSPYNLLGAAGPVAAELPAAKRELGRAAQAVATKVLPKPQANPAAVSLAKKGVPLTVGQLAPDSTLGIMEEASAQNAFGMAKERGAGVDSWRGLARGAGRVEGDTLPLPTEATAANAALHDRVGKVYSEVGAGQVQPESLANLATDSLAKMRGIDARTQAAAAAEIKNALTVLPQEAGASITVADLVKVRSNVRAETRSAVTAQDFDRVRVLKVAEDAVTRAIHENLTSEASKRLGQADAAYRKIMTVENAPPTGQVEFTPQQLLREVERSVGTRSFARGGGGELRELGDAGAATFNLRTPPTGLRQGIMSAIPWGTKLMAPAVRIANTPLIRNALFPQLAPPPTQMPNIPPTPKLQLPGAGATSAASLQDAFPWTLAPQPGAARQAVPSPKALAAKDPVVGEAYQKGGSLSAAATFYSEAQKRPDEILSWLNEGRIP